MTEFDDAYLDWYVGEFYLYKSVFTVFRMEGQPSWYSVAAFDGKQTSTVCEFELGSEPIWTPDWKAATAQHNEIAAQARRVVKQPSRE